MAEMKDKNSVFFIELYILELKNGTSYIASCDEDITFDGKVFTAIPFQRGDISKSIDSVTNECEIRIGDVEEYNLATLMNGLDFRGCNCTILRIMYPDSLSDNSILQVLFKGYIDTPQYEDGVFSCTIKDYFPAFELPARDYKTACNSIFGDENCTQSISRDIVNVQSVGGNTIYFDRTFPANTWQFGVASFNGETRNISYSDGNSITVGVNFLQNLSGHQINLRNGCDKTLACCKRYNNTIHFGGFPAIPFEGRYVK